MFIYFFFLLIAYLLARTIHSFFATSPSFLIAYLASIELSTRQQKSLCLPSCFVPFPFPFSSFPFISSYFPYLTFSSSSSSLFPFISSSFSFQNLTSILSPFSFFDFFVLFFLLENQQQNTSVLSLFSSIFSTYPFLFGIVVNMISSFENQTEILSFSTLLGFLDYFLYTIFGDVMMNDMPSIFCCLFKKFEKERKILLLYFLNILCDYDETNQEKDIQIEQKFHFDNADGDVVDAVNENVDDLSSMKIDLFYCVQEENQREPKRKFNSIKKGINTLELYFIYRSKKIAISSLLFLKVFFLLFYYHEL